MPSKTKTFNNQVVTNNLSYSNVNEVNNTSNTRKSTSNTRINTTTSNNYVIKKKVVKKSEEDKLIDELKRSPTWVRWSIIGFIIICVGIAAIAAIFGGSSNRNRQSYSNYSPAIQRQRPSFYVDPRPPQQGYMYLR